jgi:hypothetical protein
MEIKKLRYFLKSQTASLLANVAIFTALINLATMRSLFFTFVWIIDVLYLRAKFYKNEAIRPSVLFLTFCGLSFFGLWSVSGTITIVVSLAMAAFLFFFLGAQTFYFAHSKTALAAFYYVTMFGSAAAFAALAPSDIWWLPLVLMGGVFYGMSRDFLKIETGGIDLRKKVYAMVFAFISAQLAWVGSLLPIGFLNVGSLVLVFSIVSGDVAIGHFTGHLDKKTVIKHAAFFTAFVVLIILVGMA